LFRVCLQFVYIFIYRREVFLRLIVLRRPPDAGAAAGAATGVPVGVDGGVPVEVDVAAIRGLTTVSAEFNRA
jgi:hypothetical protein